MRAVLLGLLLIWLLRASSCAGTRLPARDPEVRYRVADRDAHRVVALDEQLGRVHETEIAWPEEVRVDGDGWVWILSAPGPGAGVRAHRAVAAPWRVLGIDGEGRGRILRLLPRVTDLAVGPCGRLWALCAGWERVLPVDIAAPAIRLPPDPTVLVASQDELVVGFAGGWIIGVDPVLARMSRVARLCGDIRALVAVREGGYWVLHGSNRVSRLDQEFGIVSTSLTDLRESDLAGGVAARGVWLFDRQTGRVQRIGQNGLPEPTNALPLAGIECGWALEDGGLIVGGGGAVLRLNGSGEPVLGQGLFAYVCSLAGPESPASSR